MSDIPQFARSGRTSQFGKSDEELKTKVPEIIKAQFMAFSASEGIASSELLRDVVTQFLHGSVEPKMKDIIWDHVCHETDSVYLREILHKVIYGVLHVDSVAAVKDLNSSSIGTSKGRLS